MIRPLMLLLAVLPELSASPCAAQEPIYVVDFTVSVNGQTIAEGSGDPRTGSSVTETITRVFQPVCPRGEVEHGYRKITLDIVKNNNSGSQARIYFNIVERREIFDRDNDECAKERPEDIDHSYHGYVDLEHGEETSINVGKSAMVVIRRR
jgi:hypothetical protein